MSSSPASLSNRHSASPTIREPLTPSTPASNKSAFRSVGSNTSKNSLLYGSNSGLPRYPSDVDQGKYHFFFCFL